MGRTKRLSVGCDNPGCPKLITPIKRIGNKEGVGLYCSRRCYYEWTPGMAQVYKKFKLKLGVHPNFIVYSKDHKAFMKSILIMIVQQYPSWTVRAHILGVARHTIKRWLQFFEVKEDLWKKKKRLL